EHSIVHFGDGYYVLTNWEAQNFRLMRAPEATMSDKSTWTEVVPHRADAYLENIEVFAHHLVLNERKDAMLQLHVMPLDAQGGEEHYVSFDEDVFTAWPSDNPDFDASVLRFKYTSLTTPNTVYNYDLSSRTLELKKRDEVLGGFERDNYVSELRWVTARDGEKVPVNLVRRTATPLDGTAPLYVTGYGSYGGSMDPYFSGARLSLLFRG